MVYRHKPLVRKIHGKHDIDAHEFRHLSKRFLKGSAPFLMLFVFTNSIATAFYYAERDEICAFHNGTRFWDAVHFVLTVESSIGYGDISPCTNIGRVITLIIIFIGLPLTLICAERTGRFLERLLASAWLLILRCKKRAKTSTDMQMYEEADPPLIFALFFAMIWTLITSIYFYYTLTEQHHQKPLGWDFFGAVYMTLITFFTIGLGDLAPTRHGFILINTIFTAIGVSFITMGITLVQNKIHRAFDNLEALIKKQLAIRLEQLEAGKMAPNDDMDPEKAVKDMIKKSGYGWMLNVMSDRKLAKLTRKYTYHVRRVNEAAQTQMVQYREIGVNTDDFKDASPSIVVNSTEFSSTEFRPKKKRKMAVDGTKQQYLFFWHDELV